MSYAYGCVLSGKGGYFAPSTFWMLSDEEVAEHSNGCGPEDDWRSKFVPDNLCGVDFDRACRIHDICYWKGRDEKDKDIADIVLLSNLLIAINAHCEDKGIVKVERIVLHHAAWVYYLAVSDGGHNAFWMDKNL